MDDAVEPVGELGESPGATPASAGSDAGTGSDAEATITIDGKVYQVEPYNPGLSVTDEETYRKNRNRLSIARFPVGEEPWPDVPGTDENDGWTNIKLNVTEHGSEPDQKHLLKGGAELRLKCHVCKEPLHAAAAKKPREILEEGGFNTGRREMPDEDVVACSCANGHVTQLRQSFVKRLIR